MASGKGTVSKGAEDEPGEDQHPGDCEPDDLRQVSIYMNQSLSVKRETEGAPCTYGPIVSFRHRRIGQRRG